MFKLTAEFYGDDRVVHRLDSQGETSWLTIAHLVKRFDNVAVNMVEQISSMDILSGFFDNPVNNCCYDENKNNLSTRFCKHLLGKLMFHLIEHHDVLSKFITATHVVIDCMQVNPVYFYLHVFIRMVIMMSKNVELNTQQRSIVGKYPGINEQYDEYKCSTLFVIFDNYTPNHVLWRCDMIKLVEAYPDIKNVFDYDLVDNDTFKYLDPTESAKRIAKYLMNKPFECFCDLAEINSSITRARLFAMVNTICNYITWKLELPRCSCESPNEKITSTMWRRTVIKENNNDMILEITGNFLKNDNDDDDKLRAIIAEQEKRIERLEEALGL